ncbi:MAG TPA: ATP synthase F1 subunit gamma [Candidatus Acidoferrales bacterium]
MPTLIDFRRRIRSIKNTQQITRAMKFVAAAKLRRAQERALSARPYARQMQRVLGSALSRAQNPTHPLMARRPEERILVLVVSGDKGLCGAFNTNVLRRAQEFLREHAGRELSVMPIGKKGRDALRKRKIKVIGEYINFSSRVEFSLAREIAGRVNQMFSDGEVDAVFGVYNEFKSVLTQRLMVERLLPVDASMLESEPAEAGVAVDYIYEQPAEEIFSRLLPRYVETQVYRMMMESAAAEHAARMTAMDSATSNAAELMDQLTLHMNKVRQAAITKEIIEVVSGAASAGA